LAIAKFDTIEIPRVYVQEISREILGDKARTAGGKLRQDTLAAASYKRIWKIETRLISKAQADAILSYLEAISFGTVDFWLDEFGDEANTVSAYVEVDKESRALWPYQYRELSFTVTEQ